jgi:hypothetical protein
MSALAQLAVCRLDERHDALLTVVERVVRAVDVPRCGRRRRSSPRRSTDTVARVESRDHVSAKTVRTRGGGRKVRDVLDAESNRATSAA